MIQNSICVSYYDGNWGIESQVRQGPILRQRIIHSSASQMLQNHIEEIIILALGTILAYLVKLRPSAEHLTERISHLCSENVRKVRKKGDFKVGVAVFQEWGQKASLAMKSENLPSLSTHAYSERSCTLVSASHRGRSQSTFLNTTPISSS